MRRTEKEIELDLELAEPEKAAQKKEVLKEAKPWKAELEVTPKKAVPMKAEPMKAVPMKAVPMKANCLHVSPLKVALQRTRLKSTTSRKAVSKETAVTQATSWKTAA